MRASDDRSILMPLQEGFDPARGKTDISVVGLDRRGLFRQRDFGNLNCNIASRPLIIEIPDDAHRNDKAANNQCHKRFH